MNTTVNIGTLVSKIGSILNGVVPVLIALGVVYFIWGVIKYMVADSEEAKKKGRDTMVYGIIGFTVISALWGFTGLITQFIFGNSGTSKLPPAESGTCTLAGNPDFQGFLLHIVCLINKSIIPLIFAIATVIFIWGVVKFFIIDADEEAKREQGRQFMIWGLIALVVMLSVWGLVGILQNTFGIHVGSVLPQVHPPSQ